MRKKEIENGRRQGRCLDNSARIGYELIGDSLKEISIGRRKFFSRL